jgi:hypothetical protein
VRGRLVHARRPVHGNTWQGDTWQGDFSRANLLLDGNERTCAVDPFPADGYGLADITGNVMIRTSSAAPG